MLVEDVHDVGVEVGHQDLDGLVWLAGDRPGEVLHGVHVPAVAVEAAHAVRCHQGVLSKVHIRAVNESSRSFTVAGEGPN